jgi:hypothetical protein
VPAWALTTGGLACPQPSRHNGADHHPTTWSAHSFWF